MEKKQLIVALVLGIGLTALAMRGQVSSDPLVAEFEPATRISVELAAATTYDPAQGIVRYRYTLTSRPDSVQAVETFAVRQDAPVLQPETPPGWHGARFAADPFWSWSAVGDDAVVRPGGTVSGFAFTSKGLPGIQPFHAQGETPLPRLPEGVNAPLPQDFEDQALQLTDFFRNSIRGTTIGPTTTTTDAPAASLIAYLVEQKHAAASQGWIDNQGIVTSLDAKLQAAQNALEKGNTAAAINQLHAFREVLRAQNGKHVQPAATSLLSTGVEALLTRVQAPG